MRFSEKVLNVKCVFWFSLQLLYEAFFILSKIQRDIVINIKSLYVKYPLFLSDFNESGIFLTDFLEKLKYQFSSKSFQWEPSCYMGTDGWTDRHDEANSRFSHFSNAPENVKGSKSKKCKKIRAGNHNKLLCIL